MFTVSLDRRRRMRRLNFYHATEGDHLLRWQLWRSILLRGGPK